MHFKRSVSLAVLLVAAFCTTSCGLNKGNITGPGTNVYQTIPVDFSARYVFSRAVSGARMRPMNRLTGDIEITPMPGDSVFMYGTLADLSGGFDWRAITFWGLLRADGSIDRPFRRQVAAGGETYTFLPVIHRGNNRYPMIGQWTVNGVPVTAVDHSKYGDMFTFGVSRDSNGQAVILPLRDDFSHYGWYKLVVTGIEPDSTQYSRPVTGDLQMSYFATHTRLWSQPMIFDEAEGAWVQFIWARPGQMILVRCNKADGSMWVPGVFLEGSGGQRRLLTNIIDIDDDATNAYYPVFPAVLNEDGTWTVPNPSVDNRFVPIIIGGSPLGLLSGRPD